MIRTTTLLPIVLVACASRSPAVTTATATAPPAPPTAPRDAAVQPDVAAHDPAHTPEAACAAETPAPVQVTEESAACPPLETFVVVHRWQSDDEVEDCGPPSWVASVAAGGDAARYFRVPEDQPASQGRRFRLLAEREARDAGIVETNEALWVFAGDNAAPCQATLGRAWASVQTGDGPQYLELGRAIHGCTFPENVDGPFYALSSRQRPTACRYRAMPRAVSRGPRGLAPTLRARVPSRPCAAPACTFSWSHARYTEGAAVVDDLQAVYVFAQRDNPECSWPSDWYHVLSWTSRPGAPWVRLRATGPAVGVFSDAGGARAVVTSQTGHVEVFDLRSADLGERGAALERQWYIANEEERLGWTIQPSCL